MCTKCASAVALNRDNWKHCSFIRRRILRTVLRSSESRLARACAFGLYTSYRLLEIRLAICIPVLTVTAVLEWLTFTMINPKQQITMVFDMNCASAIYEYRFSIFPVKTMMFWCLRINEPIDITDIVGFLSLGRISSSLSRRMSIWPPTCST